MTTIPHLHARTAGYSSSIARKFYQRVWAESKNEATTMGFSEKEEAAVSSIEALKISGNSFELIIN
jgi:hypothetical protein